MPTEFRMEWDLYAGKRKSTITNILGCITLVEH